MIKLFLQTQVVSDVFMHAAFSCAYTVIEFACILEVWRALKELKLLSTAPVAEICLC